MSSAWISMATLCYVTVLAVAKSGTVDFHLSRLVPQNMELLVGQRGEWISSHQQSLLQSIPQYRSFLKWEYTHLLLNGLTSKVSSSQYIQLKVQDVWGISHLWTGLDKAHCSRGPHKLKDKLNVPSSYMMLVEKEEIIIVKIPTQENTDQPQLV